MNNEYKVTGKQIHRKKIATKRHRNQEICKAYLINPIKNRSEEIKKYKYNKK